VFFLCFSEVTAPRNLKNIKAKRTDQLGKHPELLKDSHKTEDNAEIHYSRYLSPEDIGLTDPEQLISLPVYVLANTDKDRCDFFFFSFSFFQRFILYLFLNCDSFMHAICFFFIEAVQVT
jgi:hypothetical protein